MPTPIDAVLDAVEALATMDVSALDQAGTLDLARTLETVSRRIGAVAVAAAGRLAAVAATVVGCGNAAASAGSQLAQALNIARRDAYGRVRTAQATSPRVMISGARIGATLPLLGRALAAGELSVDHARVISGALPRLKPTVSDDVRALCEKVLVEQARLCDPVELGRIARHILAMLDPDGNGGGDDARDRMEPHVGRRKDNGLTHIWGYLDDVTIEMLHQAMSGLAQPRGRERNDAADGAAPDARGGAGAPDGAGAADGWDVDNSDDAAAADGCRLRRTRPRSAGLR